ncbi:Bop3p KNAG_0H02130 [Huiozyma naganishii CBS 8797]|uniref:Uncharacterized protein n=1 Tax=Huiozyma naganishii (strain ATCC MYA-139 / BCRC 22969 / CBS 8797 / KCTC 17520 / NBRC 10181 / NCYC 3082 / Yp74L-3) TaxID=1071383 RepID=J7S1T5_HUIN7|nr:hypothetical protein KNAG_0H02130 [Kazachstania naganishii CBS 8797]CCK71627.1 hypothetical protein KNAG_0H02130 [Kazachstania naganishii CBS 8797]
MSLLELIFGVGKSPNDGTQEVPPEVLSKAIDLKIEQERTKQRYYTLETANKNIELLKTATASGVPPEQLAQLLSLGEKPSSTQAAPVPAPAPSRSPAPTPAASQQQYKFPPTPAATGTTPGAAPYHRRTNSPARIGAQAVASLSDSIVIKEEEPAERSPLRDKHTRNISLPPMNKFTNPNLSAQDPSPHSPLRFPPLDSIAAGRTAVPPQQQQQSAAAVRHGIVAKKTHRRTKSALVAPSFGVIDLSVIEQAEKRATPAPVLAQSSALQECSDDTCSESSSRGGNGSPGVALAAQYRTRPNSVNRLLNNY